MPTALGAQCNRRSLARASCPPALEGERRSVPLLPLSTLLPTQLSFQLLCSRESEPGQEAPSFFFFFSFLLPTTAFLPRFSSNPPQPPQAHSCSKPARKFLPTPTLAFRAALLRLRQSLPLEGTPVQQHPGPFTSPHPLPAPWLAPPSVLRGGNCLLGRPGAALREWLRRSGIVIRIWGWRGRARSDGRGGAVWRATSPHPPHPVARRGQPERAAPPFLPSAAALPAGSRKSALDLLRLGIESEESGPGAWAE